MVSLCMIVKNEIDVIEKSILSIRKFLYDIVDEIIVVDTGSNDGTRELVSDMGCRVYDFTWCDDFSKARNFSIDKAKNDWIMFIDADEYIYKGNSKSLASFCVQKHLTDYGNVGVENEDAESGGLYAGDMLPRVFNRKSYRFKNRIHESIYPLKNFDFQECNLEIFLKHSGYNSQTLINKNKYERNIKLIELELNKKENLYLYMHLGHNYFNSKEFERAIMKKLYLMKDV